MPRMMRKRCDSGFYHVMLRGNGQQIIFEDDADRRKFLDLLARALEANQERLIAWCLMSNHVHLIVDDPHNTLSTMVHWLATCYAGYFNNKARHVGAVFQGRFASVPIESDRQLVQAVKYVHENPARAGLAAADEYAWSSFSEYMGAPAITDTSCVLEHLGGVGMFFAMSENGAPPRYAPRTGIRVPDEAMQDVAEVALREAGYACAVGQIKALPKKERNRAIVLMKRAGLTVRQIVLLTGIGKSIVYRAKCASSGTSQS